MQVDIVAANIVTGAMPSVRARVLIEYRIGAYIALGAVAPRLGNSRLGGVIGMRQALAVTHLMQKRGFEIHLADRNVGAGIERKVVVGNRSQAVVGTHRFDHRALSLRRQSRIDTDVNADGQRRQRAAGTGVNTRMRYLIQRRSAGEYVGAGLA